ncbi:MAG: hypothetical protein ACRYHQ_31600 [Janthinobacterium lividum]
MAISNFPVSLQPAIQQGYLEAGFQQGLRSKLAFRQVADQETVATGHGDTFTTTRIGLLPDATTPINVSAVNPLSGTAAKLDSGLTPVIQSLEQYTLVMNEYGSTMDLNIITSKVGIANRFVQNAISQGEQAARTMDRLARNALYGGDTSNRGGYLSGNTYVRTASTGTQVAVDDIRGFQFLAVNGVQTAIGAGNPLPVLINGNAYIVTAAVADVANASISYGAMSGVLTLTAAVATGDAAVGMPVLSTIAPKIVRPNGRASTAALTATDQVTMSVLLDAVARLRSNAVPTVNGLYNFYSDPSTMRQLFADPDFKQLFQGAAFEAAFSTGTVDQPFLGVRFMQTTESPVYAHPTIPGLYIHNPVIVGQGALIEGNFPLQPLDIGVDQIGATSYVDGVRYVVRPPLDRLGQIVTQSWQWDGGFCTPTDITVTPSVIPTATSAALKRAVVVQHTAAI